MVTMLLFGWGPEPVVLGDGAVLVANMGATVAAATGVTLLNMGFCAMVLYSWGF